MTELFPVSSIGHNVLVPALVGGSWAKDLNVGASESPYLASIVGMHVATAIQTTQAVASDQRLAGMSYLKTLLIGSTQILALLGISRDGVVMAGGMFSGLSRQDAARLSFLLATPVIFAAGALKLGDLMGPLGDGIRGQVLVGSLLSGIGAYLSGRFLVRYFQTRTLTPFAVYCLVVGLGSIAYLSLR